MLLRLVEPFLGLVLQPADLLGAATTGTAIGLTTVGATEGALNIIEGTAEGDVGKAAFGALEVGASVLGARALAKNFAANPRIQTPAAAQSPRIATEHPVAQVPRQLALPFDKPLPLQASGASPSIPSVPMPSGSGAPAQLAGPRQLQLFPAPTAGGGTQLPVVNPHFRPDPYPVFQNLTATANQRLASNPTLAVGDHVKTRISDTPCRLST